MSSVGKLKIKPNEVTLLQMDTVRPNGSGFSLINDQGHVAVWTPSKERIMQTANHHNLKIVNETSPKHKELIQRFNARNEVVA